ncbi:hypothetical protein SOVF_160050 [Spinacia oleracea]|nr:hypothetical protein SOVF_160050 [Spinacia oleracea]
MVHGHFIASVSRDMTTQPQKGGFEAIASVPIAVSLLLAGIVFAFMSLKQSSVGCSSVGKLKHCYNQYCISLDANQNSTKG